MKNQILHALTLEVIHECDTLSVRELAVKHKARLSDAALSDADLSGADLSGADLSGADLSDADLRYADLSDANFSSADLRHADLRHADLRYADLSDADLRYADLRCASLSGADLSDANFSSADLSGATGLSTASEYLTQFEQDELGIIVYKRIGNGRTEYALPDCWTIKRGRFLTENPNPTRTQECGCGVNFGTLDWCKRNYTDAQLWKCRIRWIDVADVVVPYTTDGKARCARIELLSKIKG